MNILRRISLSHLLLLCALVVAAGASLTAIAFALGSGPTPPAKPLAEAVHDALAAPAVEGVRANIQLTNHLLEGANLASGGGESGQLASNPLLAGGSGRLWIAKDGRVRLELQAEQGDTQVIYDGHTVSVYDAASNTLYRYTVPAREPSKAEPETCSSGQATATCLSSGPVHSHEVPTVAKIEEAISHLGRNATVSGATPTDIAGQPAYTVRISPKETGSLIGGAELSWDAVHGVPLRAAIYSSTSSSPAIELATTSISYGPVEESVFKFTPPPGAKVDEIVPKATTNAAPSDGTADNGGHPHPKITVHGHGISGIAVIETNVKSGSQSSSEGMPAGLPKVSINGTSATELATELGTLLSFERSGVRYVIVGSATAAAVEAVARGL